MSRSKGIEGTRQEQMAYADKASRLLSLTMDSLDELHLLSNNEFMTNKVFRMILKSNESMNKRYTILAQRKEQLQRVVYFNA